MTSYSHLLLIRSIQIQLRSEMAAQIINVTVSVYPTMPYAGLEISDGRIKPTGALGLVWDEISGCLNYTVNSVYSLNGEEPSDIVLTAGTNVLPFGIHNAFQTSWFDIHVEEKKATIVKVSYLNGPQITWWILFGMIVAYAALLFAMLRCAEKYCPVSAVDLPVIPKLEKLWRYQNMFPKLRGKALLYRKLRVHNEESFGNCFMASVSVISSQGCYLRSHVISIRLAIITFLFFASIITIAYSAIMVSQFTTRQSAHELTVSWINEETTFCRRPNARGHNLGETHKVQYNIFPDESCIAQLCDGMPTYEATEVLYEHTSPCQHVPVTNKLIKFNLGVEISIRAPDFLKSDIREKMTRFRESGLTARITKESMKNFDRNPRDRSNQHEVSMDQAGYPFLFYIIMIFLSCGILAAEVMTYQQQVWLP